MTLSIMINKTDAQHNGMSVTYAECPMYWVSHVLSVKYLTFVLSVIMLNVVMLSFITLNVIMVSVLALFKMWRCLLKLNVIKFQIQYNSIILI